MYQSTSPRNAKNSSAEALPQDTDLAASALRDQIAQTWSQLIWAESFPGSERAVSFFQQLSARTRHLIHEALRLTHSKARDQVLKGAISLHWRNGACKDDVLTNHLAMEVARIWARSCAQLSDSVASGSRLTDYETGNLIGNTFSSSHAQMRDQSLERTISRHWENGTCEDKALTDLLILEVAQLFAQELKLRVGDRLDD